MQAAILSEDGFDGKRRVTLSGHNCRYFDSDAAFKRGLGVRYS